MTNDNGINWGVVREHLMAVNRRKPDDVDKYGDPVSFLRYALAGRLPQGVQKFYAEKFRLGPLLDRLDNLNCPFESLLDHMQALMDGNEKGLQLLQRHREVFAARDAARLVGQKYRRVGTQRTHFYVVAGLLFVPSLITGDPELSMTDDVVSCLQTIRTSFGELKDRDTKIELIDRFRLDLDRNINYLSWNLAIECCHSAGVLTRATPEAVDTTRVDRAIKAINAFHLGRVTDRKLDYATLLVSRGVVLYDAIDQAEGFVERENAGESPESLIEEILSEVRRGDRGRHANFTVVAGVAGVRPENPFARIDAVGVAREPDAGVYWEDYEPLEGAVGNDEDAEEDE